MWTRRRFSTERGLPLLDKGGRAALAVARPRLFAGGGRRRLLGSAAPPAWSHSWQESHRHKHTETQIPAGPRRSRRTLKHGHGITLAHGPRRPEEQARLVAEGVDRLNMWAGYSQVCGSQRPLVSWGKGARGLHKHPMRKSHPVTGLWEQCPVQGIGQVLRERRGGKDNTATCQHYRKPLDNFRVWGSRARA